MAQPTVWDATRFCRCHGTVTDAAGGTPDVEGRAQFALCLAALRSNGTIAGAVGSTAPLRGATAIDQDSFCYTHGVLITAPSGGATIDTQARTAVVAIIAALVNSGIVSGVGPQTNPTVWDEDVSCQVNSVALADPTGGATIDVELRAAIVQTLAAMRSANLIAQD
jgi:hypothetical protein